MCISQKVRVENMFGLHARPASKLVNLAKEYKADIYLYKQGQDTIKADCKSLISVLTLGAHQGTELILHGIGEDAQDAVNKVVDLFENNFYEVV